MTYGINKKNKVVIIGMGMVGASISYALALQNIAWEIVLIDIDKNKAIGEVWDIQHGIPDMGASRLYVGNYSDCADSDLIIIAVGRSRRLHETRLDMIHENIKILHASIKSIQRYYTRGIVLIISNPVDILTQKASEWMNLPNGMVFGSGCLLDTSRFIRIIAEHIGLTPTMINGYIVGEHGDSQIPIWSQVAVGGIPIEKYCDHVQIEWNARIRDAIETKTRNMGSDIIGMKGRTHYGIATCVSYLAKAILNCQPIIVSVCSPLQGEYGLEKLSLSMPSIVSSCGVQNRILGAWTKKEEAAFLQAGAKMNHVLKSLSEK